MRFYLTQAMRTSETSHSAPKEAVYEDFNLFLAYCDDSLCELFYTNLKTRGKTVANLKESHHFGKKVRELLEKDFRLDSELSTRANRVTRGFVWVPLKSPGKASKAAAEFHSNESRMVCQLQHELHNAMMAAEGKTPPPAPLIIWYFNLLVCTLYLG